jgi:iron complex transport system substrate-binding protein
MKLTGFLRFMILLTLMSCHSSEKNHDATISKKIDLTYAKRFKIKTYKDYTTIELLGNKNNAEVTATFILYKNKKPTHLQDVYYIKIPVKKIACLSSIYSTMLVKLNAQSHIAAIDNVDYYTNQYIINAVNNHTIIELSREININVEKTLVLNPDLLIAFGMGNPANDIDKKLQQTGIPIAISLDHLEETPLARAEWIKFFGYFLDKEKIADSLFSLTEKKYNNLKLLTKNLKNKRSVLTEIKYGDAWYIPSGKSYMANLLKDAGAIYLLGNPNETGSTPQTFEYVYNAAKNCDVWLNLYNLNFKKELLSYDNRYGLFNAYKKNELYNNNKNQNSKGYSDYWETGIVNPDEVLADMIYILYPQLLQKHQLKYYKKLE